MSIIFRDSPPSTEINGISSPSLIEMFGSQILECDICGENSAFGFWQGIKQISVCRHCAVECLVKLIADAVVGPHGSNYERLAQTLERISSVFWRACIAAEDSVKRHRRQQVAMRCPPGRPAVVDGGDDYDENGNLVS